MEVKRITTNTLAVIGFIAVVFLGILLAVYAARFVPTAVNGFATAVVSVTSVFFPAEEVVVVNGDEEVPVTPTELEVPAPAPEAPTPPPATGGTQNPPAVPAPGAETVTVVPQNPGAPISDPNGLPDLVPVILATGKLVGGVSAENFVETNQLTRNDRIAVKFAIENRGTKATGTNWRFNVIMLTESTYIFEAQPSHIQDLNPGDRVEYVIGFDRARVGTDLQISVPANHTRTLVESNFDNNGAFVKINVTN